MQDADEQNVNLSIEDQHDKERLLDIDDAEALISGRRGNRMMTYNNQYNASSGQNDLK